jgi:acyl-CoA thioester hydrolase
VNNQSFSHRLRIRYSECDPQGVVFNGWFLFYYDVALTELHREALGPYSDFAGEGHEVVVAEFSIRYRAAVRFDDWLTINLAILRLGRTSFDVSALFDVEDQPVATAEARHVVIDARSGSKAPLPEKMREAFSLLLASRTH